MSVNKEILNLLMSGMSSTEVHKLVREAAAEKARLDEEKIKEAERLAKEKAEKEAKNKLIEHCKVNAANAIARYFFEVGAITQEERESVSKDYLNILDRTAYFLIRDRVTPKAVRSFEEFLKEIDMMLEG